MVPSRALANSGAGHALHTSRDCHSHGLQYMVTPNPTSFYCPSPPFSSPPSFPRQDSMIHRYNPSLANSLHFLAPSPFPLGSPGCASYFSCLSVQTHPRLPCSMMWELGPADFISSLPVAPRQALPIEGSGGRLRAWRRKKALLVWCLLRDTSGLARGRPSSAQHPVHWPASLFSTQRLQRPCSLRRVLTLSPVWPSSRSPDSFCAHLSFSLRPGSHSLQWRPLCTLQSSVPL